MSSTHAHLDCRSRDHLRDSRLPDSHLSCAALRRAARAALEALAAFLRKGSRNSYNGHGDFRCNGAFCRRSWCDCRNRWCYRCVTPLALARLLVLSHWCPRPRPPFTRAPLYRRLLTGGFGLFVLPCVVYANLRYPEMTPARRLLTPTGVCGVIGCGVAVVNATMTFINIAAGSEAGPDDGQCGVPPQSQ